MGPQILGLKNALKTLGNEFPNLNWDFRPDPSASNVELISQWLGRPKDEIMVCAFSGANIDEHFHRQDFFFINFAYKGNYEALSANSMNRVMMNEGDCYIGQPYSGYALKKNGKENIIIVGVLIKKETFLHEFLNTLAANSSLLHFFLEPTTNRFADGIIRFTPHRDSPIWTLLNMMIVEYANRSERTQLVLKTLFSSMAVYMANEYHAKESFSSTMELADQIINYIEIHSDTVTLQSLATHFGYHPVYISRLLPQKTGKNFSQVLLEFRMQKASILLKSTDLPNEKIASMLGYSNNSNFYKAYREYFGKSPRAALG